MVSTSNGDSNLRSTNLGADFGASSGGGPGRGARTATPRRRSAEHSRGGDLRLQRPLGEADPAGAPPADEDVGGGDRQRPEQAVGVVAAHRRGRHRREIGAG